MFKAVFTFLFLTVSVFCIAEVSSKEDSLKKKERMQHYYRNELFISPSLSIDHSYRRLKHETSDDGINYSEELVEIFDSIESPRISYSAGIMFDFIFRRHWGVQMGIYYSDKGRKHDNMLVCYNDAYPLFYPSLKTTTHFHYLDVPVGLTYQIPLNTKEKREKKLRFATGLLWSIQLSENKMEFWSHGHAIPVKQIVIDSIVEFGESLKFHKIGFYISSSFTLPLSNRIQLSLSPWFRYSLISWHKTGRLFGNKNNLIKSWEYYMPIDAYYSWPCTLQQIDDLPYSFGLRLDFNFLARKQKEG